MTPTTKDAMWRAVWTWACVGLSCGMIAILNDPTLATDFLTGKSDQVFWRIFILVFLSGAFNGIRKYVTTKIAESGNQSG